VEITLDTASKTSYLQSGAEESDSELEFNNNNTDQQDLPVALPLVKHYKVHFFGREAGVMANPNGSGQMVEGHQLGTHCSFWTPLSVYEALLQAGCPFLPRMESVH
jgi:hypothetical protein